MTFPITLKFADTNMFDKHKSSKQGSPQIKESITLQEDAGVAVPAQSRVSRSALIGPDIEITGDVTASADIKINGHIKGTIVESSHVVEIGESGKITANISAKTVIVSGLVEGNIIGSEKIVISRSGSVRGDLAAPRVQLEDGALFRGSIEMDPSKVAKPKSRSAGKKEAKSSRAGSSTKDSGNGTSPVTVKDKEAETSGLTLKSD
jgi:cytoskeletal protein CcmA (bactofilin family)